MAIDQKSLKAFFHAPFQLLYRVGQQVFVGRYYYSILNGFTQNLSLKVFKIR